MIPANNKSGVLLWRVPLCVTGWSEKDAAVGGSEGQPVNVENSARLADPIRSLSFVSMKDQTW